MNCKEQSKKYTILALKQCTVLILFLLHNSKYICSDEERKEKFDVNHKKKGKKKMWRLFFEIRKIKFLLTRNKSFCYLCILSFLITKSDKIVASKCRKKNKRKICLFDYYLHSNNQHRVITIANTSLCQCLDFDFLLW